MPRTHDTLIEKLQPRQMLAASFGISSRGQLYVTTDDAANVMSFGVNKAQPDKLRVVVDGVVKKFDRSVVKRLRIMDRGGDNSIDVHGAGLRSTIITALGNDTITGGYREDDIQDLGGTNLILCGDGNDTVAGGQNDDTIDGGAGDDRLRGDYGPFSGGGNDKVYGGEGDDILYGGNGNDFLNSGNGKDRLYGQDGDDTIIGGGGTDRLYGGEGVDTRRRPDPKDAVDNAFEQTD